MSPFAIHQQHVAMLAQQQALYMAAAAKAAGGIPNGVNQQAIANALSLASANWSNTGYQIPGMTNPGGGQADHLQKLMQVSISFLLLFHQDRSKLLVAQVPCSILTLCYIAVNLEYEHERKHERETRTTASKHSSISSIQVCKQYCFLVVSSIKM